MFNYDDFAKLDIRIGTIIEASKHPDADKLLVLKVNMGNGDVRQIVAGIAKHYLPEDLKDMMIVVVVNLEPRILRGVESQGMLLAASSDNMFSLLTIDQICPNGSKVG